MRELAMEVWLIDKFAAATTNLTEGEGLYLKKVFAWIKDKKYIDFKFNILLAVLSMSHINAYPAKSALAVN